MADDSPKAPKAGGTLDLSTGRPAPPPPEPPALRPSVTPDPEVRAGRTLDLSVGRPSVERRRPAAASLGHGPVVRETLDLSTKTVPTETEAPPAPKAQSPRPPTLGPKPTRPQGDSRDRGKAPASAASSLADLLDPEILHKLRGG